MWPPESTHRVEAATHNNTKSFNSRARETIQKYAPQATVDQVTLMLGVSGAIIYNSTIEALKDKLGVSQPRLNTLLKKLLHMAVDSLNRIWDQRWAMINSLRLEDAKRAPRPTGRHKNTMRST
jgi:AraC-like DNA-binding protein